jgi:type II secretory pathway component PulM
VPAREVLTRLWQARNSRERRLLTLGAVVLGLGLLLMLADWLHQERQRLDLALPRLEAQLLRMQEDASEIARLRQLPPAHAGARSTQAQVDAVSAGARSRGLSLAIQPAGDRVQLRGQVAFDALSTWLASLHRDQGLQVLSADIRSEGPLVVVDILLGAPGER